MLVQDDIGRLFAIMKSAYGWRWQHGADDVPVWLAKLKRYDQRQLKRAASRCIDQHPDVPTLNQFIAAVKADRPPPSTLTLPSPAFDQANADKAWDQMEALAGKPLRPTKENTSE